MRYSLCYLSIAYIYAYIYVLVSFHPSIISAHDIPVQDQPHLSSDPTHVKPTPFDIEPLPHPVPVGNPSPFQLKQNPDSTPVENPSPFVLEPLPLPVPVDPVPIITQLMDYNFTDPVVEIPIPILLNSTTLNTTSPVNVAGNGVPGYAGDGTNNTVVTEIRFPNAVVLDSSQNIFIADTFNHVIRMVSNATGVISTYAGMALSGVPDCLSGCLATKSVLESPKYVTFDIFGNLYVSDSGNHVVKKIAKDTTNITVVAGVLGQYWGSPGDGGLATAATLISPYGIAFDSHNNLYISDISANFIRKVDGITGMISTFAGLYDGLHFSFTNASSDTLGTNALYPAVEVALSGPAGMQIDQNDQLFIADTYNNVVRVMSLSLETETILAGIAGSFPSYTGDGYLAVNATLNLPYDVSFDRYGSIYIADSGNNAIRILTDVDGSFVISSLSGDFNMPHGVFVFESSDIYVADTNSNIVKKFRILE